MNREQFGELIAALRDDLGWTQTQLAERADMDAPTISGIERGAKKHFAPDLLSNLAGALDLTRAERQQFFLAASGLDEQEMMRPGSGYSPDQAPDSTRQLERLVQLVARLRVPCYLVDVYQDVIAANAIAAALFRVPVDCIDELRKIPGGLTALWVIRGEGWARETAASGQWEAFAIDNMRDFRENSLRYRARPYFKYLMKEFQDQKKYPGFQRYWRLASTRGEDAESRPKVYASTHAEHGSLSYHVFSAYNTTPHGELFLYQLVPTDERTTDLFEDLARSFGPHAHRLAPWPEKLIQDYPPRHEDTK